MTFRDCCEPQHTTDSVMNVDTGMEPVYPSHDEPSDNITLVDQREGQTSAEPITLLEQAEGVKRDSGDRDIDLKIEPVSRSEDNRDEEEEIDDEVQIIKMVAMPPTPTSVAMPPTPTTMGNDDGVYIPCITPIGPDDIVAKDGRTLKECAVAMDAVEDVVVRAQKEEEDCLKEKWLAGKRGEESLRESWLAGKRADDCPRSGIEGEGCTLNSGEGEDTPFLYNVMHNNIEADIGFNNLQRLKLRPATILFHVF